MKLYVTVIEEFKVKCEWKSILTGGKEKTKPPNRYCVSFLGLSRSSFLNLFLVFSLEDNLRSMATLDKVQSWVTWPGKL